MFRESAREMSMEARRFDSREIRAPGSCHAIERETVLSSVNTRFVYRYHGFPLASLACTSLGANRRRARNLKSVQPVARTFLHMKDIAEITRYVSNHNLRSNVHTRRERASRH